MRRIYLLLAVFVLAAAVLGCGGDDNADAALGGDGSGEPLSADARIEALEAEVSELTDLLFALYETGGGEVDEGGAPVLVAFYTLEREAAQENEREIVRQMAECFARGFLNPDLPQQAKEYYTRGKEDELWAGLAAGQYSSFEFFVGIAQNVCFTPLVDEGS